MVSIRRDRFPELMRLVSLASICLTGSCDRSPTVPDVEHSAAASPVSQWAGGVIRIELEGLEPGDIEAVLAGSDSLAFAPETSSSLSAHLPADADGALEIWLETTEGRIGAGLVDVHGFEGSEVIAPRLIRGLRDWPAGPGGAAVLGSTRTGLAILRPGLRSSNTFEGIHDGGWLYSPGQSADPLDVYTRAQGQNSITRWQLTTAVSPTPLDTIPLTASWSIARGAPDVWFVAYHHFLQARRGPASDGSFETLLDIQAEETLDWEFLQHPGVVAPAGSSYREGLPIFSMSSGDIAYRVPGVFESHALVALPGDGRFAVAGRVDSGSALTVFDGSTGEVEGQVAIEGYAANLEHDPRRGVFFVLHAYPWQDGFVGVHDASTLEIIGRMHLPGLNFWDAELALDETRLFVVFGESSLGDGATNGTVVYRYRLP